MDDVFEKIEKIEGIAIEHQTSKETLISQFTNVCNNYLIGKELIYNGDLEVYTKKGCTISLDWLSSGEKQIISIFSHLYLSSPKKCAILIDEPELSISIEWQKKLLPDILKNPKCQFLVAATHSPFIFDEELIVNTVDLQQYIREYDECHQNS
jgi:predicted ATPase